MDCKDVSAETLYDVLHDIEYRKKWDTNVIETFDIGKLTVNADVGYYSCEKLGKGGTWMGGIKLREVPLLHTNDGRGGGGVSFLLCHPCLQDGQGPWSNWGGGGTLWGCSEPGGECFASPLTGVFFSLLAGKCPKPLKNRDVITLRSWLPMGNDYIIMNYSVKHPVSAPLSWEGVSCARICRWASGVEVGVGEMDEPVFARIAQM